MSYWQRIDSDEQFAEIFRGASVQMATTVSPPGLPYIGADLFWQLLGGVWVALELTDESDWYGGSYTTRHYWLWDPEALPPEPQELSYVPLDVEARVSMADSKATSLSVLVSVMDSKTTSVCQ